MLNADSPRWRPLLLALALALAGRSAAADPPTLPPPQAARVFQDWTLSCHDACAISTRVLSADGRATELLRLGIAEAGDGLAIATPLPLYLPDPVILTLGNADPRAIPWRTCGPLRCEAEATLAPELLADLRRQRDATVAFTLVDGSRVRVPVSLRGFSAAERALRVSGP